MTLTNDQYYGLSVLNKWYRKYQNQFIEISGVIGTGTWELVQEFIEYNQFNEREVMYLSYNQKQVLELAFQKYHAYYINRVVYKYTRIVDFDSLPILNRLSREVKYEWKKEVRKKINPNYRLIVIFDSLLLNENIMKDISKFGLPIILIRDPMLIPAPDTYTFLRDPNIELHDVHEDNIKSPITYFAHKILRGESMKIGNYDNVSIVSRKQMNLYNLKSSDMNITISNRLMNEINLIYREKILNKKSTINSAGERVIVTDTLYPEKIINPDNPKVRVYLTKGMVGTLSQVNRHALGTKYIGVDFLPEFYHEPFVSLMMDRHHLNNIEAPSQQLIPDEIFKVNYAYALTSSLSVMNHWDKVTLIMDSNEEGDEDLQKRLLYTAITRARKLLTIIT